MQRSQKEYMGKLQDFLSDKIGRKSKLKLHLNLAISRSTVLTNGCRSRLNHDRSTIIDLLNSGKHEQALQRVEYIIMEMNKLDVLDLVEWYCKFLTERAEVIERLRTCPTDMKEPIATLVFAASRYGDLPELEKIRSFFKAKYGKDFIQSAIELRTDCNVHSRMIEKLSGKRPSKEDKLRVLREIAIEQGSILNLPEDDGTPPEKSKEENDFRKTSSLAHISLTKEKERGEEKLIEEQKDNEKVYQDMGINPETMFSPKQYSDAESAARDAHAAAQYAARAARAAVELSRSQSQEKDSDDSRTPKTNDNTDSSSNEISPRMEMKSREQRSNWKFDKIHSVPDLSSDSGDESVNRRIREKRSENKIKRRGAMSPSPSSSDSDGESVSISLREKKLENKMKRGGGMSSSPSSSSSGEFEVSSGRQLGKPREVKRPENRETNKNSDETKRELGAESNFRKDLNELSSRNRMTAYGRKLQYEFQSNREFGEGSGRDRSNNDIKLQLNNGRTLGTSHIELQETNDARRESRLTVDRESQKYMKPNSMRTRY